jgi:heme-degrading monooxygenase HmoA
VRDDGPGIPPEQQEQLFERFRKGPGRPRSEAAGLGLPDMDGFDLLDELRQVDQQLPVVILTARDSVGDTVSWARGRSRRLPHQAVQHGSGRGRCGCP